VRTDSDIEWLIGINGGFCVEKELYEFMPALVWTHCDCVWVIGINDGFLVEKKL
jgi:hypothetical protein